MNKYITEDKIADFVTAMWKAGFKTAVDPDERSITVYKNGSYEFVDIYAKHSFDELITSITQNKD